MDYENIHIAEGYGNKGLFIAEIGMQAKPLKGLTIAAHLYNPTRNNLQNITRSVYQQFFASGLFILF